MIDPPTDPTSQRGKPIPITQPTVLVVEGPGDDKLFFERLLEIMQIPNVDVVPMDGTSGLDGVLEILAKEAFVTKKVRSIGIIRDANTNRQCTVKNVREALHKHGLPVPEDEMVSVGTHPQVCFLLMPGKGKQGMLEDLCLKSVKDEPAMRCVEQYFDCLERQSVPLPPRKELSKAKVHAYLSSKTNPSVALGRAATYDYWPWDHPAFEEVKQFLTTVCGITSS